MEISHMQQSQQPPQINQNYVAGKTAADQNNSGAGGEFKDDLSQRERNIMKHSSIVQIMNEKFLFKHHYPIEKRMQWSKEARLKYSNKLPLIVEKDHKCQALDDLTNPKFLMPRTFSISEVQMIIRRKLNLRKEQGLFLMVNDGKDIVKANQSLENVFETYKDEDGFLYILYTQEDMFGQNNNKTPQ